MTEHGVHPTMIRHAERGELAVANDTRQGLRGPTGIMVLAPNKAIHRFGARGFVNTDQDSQFASFAWTDRLKRVGDNVAQFSCTRQFCDG